MVQACHHSARNIGKCIPKIIKDMLHRPGFSLTDSRLEAIRLAVTGPCCRGVTYRAIRIHLRCRLHRRRLVIEAPEVIHRLAGATP